MIAECLKHFAMDLSKSSSTLSQYLIAKRKQIILNATNRRKITKYGGVDLLYIR
jgi:hypothetical protein